MFLAIQTSWPANPAKESPGGGRKAGAFCHSSRESHHGRADSVGQEMAEEDVGATGRTKQAVGRNRPLSENDIIH